jgi:hypothetical protein
MREGVKEREKGPKWNESRAMLLILTSNGNSLRNYGKRKKKKKTKLGGGERSAFSDQYLGDLVAEADEKGKW